jgi:hypothetical protein
MAMLTKKVAKEADEADAQARRRQRELEEEVRAAEQAAGEEGGVDVDDDEGWMNHDLKFEVDEKELTRRAEDEYAVSCLFLSMPVVLLHGSGRFRHIAVAPSSSNY